MLSEVWGTLSDIRAAIRIAFLPTLKSLLLEPAILLNPRRLSRLFFAHLWVVFGVGVDTASAEVKKSLVTPYAYGVVLDIGAGHGHTVKYLDRSRVTQYIALEPNERMVHAIQKTTSDAGFDYTTEVQILTFGAEDIESIVTALGGRQVDTIISILSFCTVPDPQKVVPALLTRLLKPGGQLLFYEHVKSERKDIAWWQWALSPLWATAFGGCRMDRPTHEWIKQVGGWSICDMWLKQGEDPHGMFGHRVGRFVRASE